MKQNNSPSTKSLLWAFFIGAVSGLLFAPKSGRGTREWIMQQGAHLSSQGRRLVDRSGAQIRYRSGALQGITHKMKDLIAPEPKLLEADDDTIEQRVRTELGENSSTWNLPHLNVNNERGKVTVRGPVKSNREKENVEKVTKRVPGVKEVFNKTKLVA